MTIFSIVLLLIQVWSSTLHPRPTSWTPSVSSSQYQGKSLWYSVNEISAHSFPATTGTWLHKGPRHPTRMRAEKGMSPCFKNDMILGPMCGPAMKMPVKMPGVLYQNAWFGLTSHHTCLALDPALPSAWCSSLKAVWCVPLRPWQCSSLCLYHRLPPCPPGGSPLSIVQICSTPPPAWSPPYPSSRNARSFSLVPQVCLRPASF